MERTTFLKNYRIRLKYDGSPHEPDRDGPAISYEAVDERTAEPVSVTLIPAESIDPRGIFQDGNAIGEVCGGADVGDSSFARRDHAVAKRCNLTLRDASARRRSRARGDQVRVFNQEVRRAHSVA